MPESLGAPSQRVLRIGPDRVTVTDTEVVIEAKHEMPEWEVRSSRPPAIYFEDKKFLLIGKDKAEAPYGIRYTLQPWPEGKASNPNNFHTYDAATVAERGSSHRSELWGQLAWSLLLPFYPFLGLLWARTQERLGRLGFIPRSLTGISIFTSFGLFLAQGVMAAVMINASIRSGKLMIGGVIRAMTDQSHLQLGQLAISAGIIDAVLLAGFLADAVFRYAHYLGDDQWTGGFLEWLVPKSLRRK